MPKDDLREPQIVDARKSNSCSGFSDFEFQELKKIVSSIEACSENIERLNEIPGYIKSFRLLIISAVTDLQTEIDATGKELKIEN